MTTATVPFLIGNTLESIKAYGKAHGPEALRECWRAAHALHQDPSVKVEHQVHAADMMSLIERAAVQLRQEAIERNKQASVAVARAVAATALPNLAHAYYAVDHDGVVKFYRVDKPTEGKWAGRTFLKVQASEEYYPIKDATYRTEIFELIAKDPQAAMERYGREIGRCGHCHRTLTNAESIARGIGPICAGRMGW